MRKTAIKKKKSEFALTEGENESLDAMLARLGVTIWDMVIFGDGSASTWLNPGGWASVLIERASRQRLVFTGCADPCTVNFAEIMAYLQPAAWIQAHEEELRHKSGKFNVYQIHIFTDSDYCRTMGEANNPLPQKNGVLWSAFEDLKRFGFLLRWHWIRRSSAPLNVFCDHMSRELRLLIQESDVQSAVEQKFFNGGHGTYTVNDLNP